MNGSVMKIAGEDALRQNIVETKRYISEHGGSGHTILNASGTSMPQRSNLQFSGGLTTSDDSTNGKTVVSVDVTNQITQSETKPVSSGAVYTAIGNIETLLASI